MVEVTLFVEFKGSVIPSFTFAYVDFVIRTCGQLGRLEFCHQVTSFTMHSGCKSVTFIYAIQLLLVDALSNKISALLQISANSFRCFLFF